MILDAHPEATVLVWPAHKIIRFGLGPKKMTEHYAYLAVHPGHVNLGLYHGARLGGTEVKLEGTGKSLRHVKVRTLAETKAPVLGSLAHAARKHQAQLINHAVQRDCPMRGH